MVTMLCPLQPELEQPIEQDTALATNLERQLLYTARPSLIEAKPVSVCACVCVCVCVRVAI